MPNPLEPLPTYTIRVHRLDPPLADAHRTVGKRADRAMDVRSAVQAGAYCDLERLIENAADLRCRERFRAQAQRAHAVAHVAMAEDFVAADLVQSLPQP